MFQFSFVLCTIKYKMRLGEKFFLNLNKETSCEIDKVRKLSKRKHVEKDLFVWIAFLYVFIQFAAAFLKSSDMNSRANKARYK